MEVEATDDADALLTRRGVVATVYRRRSGLSVSELRLLVERLGVTATAAELVADARALGLTVELGADDVLHLGGTIVDEPAAAAPAVVSSPASVASDADEADDAQDDSPRPIAHPGHIMALMVGALLLIALIGVVLGGSY